MSKPPRAESPKPLAKNSERVPDVGKKQYRAVGREGALVFRQQFILAGVEPPCDVIRRLLTQIEFEGQVSDPASYHNIESACSRIEEQLATIRAAALRNVQCADGGGSVESSADR